MAIIDILIPTYNRAAALAVTLTSLCAQSFQDFRVIISDQTEEYSAVETGEVQAAIRVLQAHGQEVQTLRHLPRRGIAEQRQFLLDQATAPYVLYLDDDLILEPWLIGNLWRMIEEQGCGFVGSAMIGLSFRSDMRPQQQQIEFWQGAVQPEIVTANTPQWNRYQLHNAANVYHVQQQLQLTPNQPRLYRVAWVAGCILYDHAKLRDVGGFEFWRELPLNHCGEDVLVQLRLLAKYGGCGMLPSGAYHQESPTTIPDRHFDAPHLLPILPLAGEIHA